MKWPMKSLALSALALALSPIAGAQSVGKMLSDVDLEGFSQTEARTFDDLTGRAVLIEFFAFW